MIPIPMLAKGLSTTAKIGRGVENIALGAGVASFAGQAGGGIVDEVSGKNFRGQRDQLLRAGSPLRGGTFMQAMRMQERMKEAEARLAAMQPHLYTELLTGRKLSPGTRVYGLRQNREQLNEVLMRMVSGVYGQGG